MALDSKSPNLPSSTGTAPEAGLGYSRHYARKIRSLGQSTKESLIQRLFNHMFGGGGGRTHRDGEKISNLKEEESIFDKAYDENGVATNVELNREETEESVRNGQGRQRRRRSLSSGSEASDSPERTAIPSHPEPTVAAKKFPGKEGVVVVDPSWKNVKKEAGGPRKISRQGAQASQRALQKEFINSPYLPSAIRAAVRKQQKAKANNGNAGKRKHPWLSSHGQQQDEWKPPLQATRGPAIIHLENRAKKAVDRAVKSGKIFTCEAPYPVDAYVRYSLRKRGWVEKFSQRVNQMTSKPTSTKRLACQEEEDFDAICAQNIPAPWKEDSGVYAIMSRLTRHYPSKFIWGGPSLVNNLILKSDITVNHFLKARSFSSKVCLAVNLRELPWLQSFDPLVFFPRSYVLNEDEKDDIIEDFRLTACINVLKCVVANSSNKSSAGRDSNVSESAEKSGEDWFLSGNNNNTNGNNNNNNVPISDQNILRKSNADKNSSTYTKEDGSEREEEVIIMGCRIAPIGVVGEDDDEPSSLLVYSDRHGKVQEGQVEQGNGNATKVLPDLQSVQRKPRGGEVPEKALEFVLSELQKFIRFKAHDDIDLRSKRYVSDAQWNEALLWSYEITRECAAVPTSESQLEQCKEILKQMEQLWPQFYLDGTKNIWIVKPGEKSKGIGIEFCDKLDTILKYVGNSTTQGTYIVQKYIERPLLIYQCKFDIRQWFLVTEWNPLTVWCYMDSYLRICSQEYDIDAMHESVHLSNVAIQQNYLNGQRSEKLPENNFMTSSDFKRYLRKTDGRNWRIEKTGRGQYWR